MKSTNDRYIFSVFLIALVGFVTRLFVIFLLPNNPVSDYWIYFKLGINLADYGTLEITPGVPFSQFPPAYPVFLSLFFQLPVGDRLLIAKIANNVLMLLSICFIGVIGRRVFNQITGLVASILLAFLPRSVLLTTIIASENLFIPLLLLWVIIATEKKTTIANVISLGIVTALLSLTRSLAYLLWVVWIFKLIVSLNSPKYIIMYASVLLVIQHLIMLPWGLWNLNNFGKFNFLTSVGGVDLYIGNNDNATGGWYEWYKDPVFVPFSGQDVDINSVAKKEAVIWIMSNPLQAIKLYLKKLYIILKNEDGILYSALYALQASPPVPPADALPADHPLKTPSIRGMIYVAFNFSYWILIILFLIGVFVWIKDLAYKKSSQLDPIILLGVALYLVLIPAVFLGSNRFQWPFTDVILPLASYGVVTSWLFFQGTIKNFQARDQFRYLKRSK